ncbi:MAG: contractile injection system protein, VgrG/Pvc8 family [Defluviitaleaceae bacterium]|nr:contractile injection system protein, VgrG/Pvc8 family [Defluviitaleaceae bacterium]
MAQSINHKLIELVGLPAIRVILDINFSIKPNTHGVMKLRGYGAKDSPTLVKEIKTGTQVTFLARGNAVFAGLVTDCRLVEDIEMRTVEVTITTATISIDREPKSRSFQDVSMTYRQVIKKVLKDTSGARLLFSVDDKPIGKPIIQYRETDWEFIKRLASHFNTSIIADPKNPTADIWFGLNKSGDDTQFADFEEKSYTVGVSDNFYKENARSIGISKLGFKYYKIDSYGHFNIGDKATFKDVEFKIVEKQARFDRSEMIFTYTLAKDSYLTTETKFNDKAIGMSLVGEVMKTERELVNIKLDIDGANGGYEYQYKWKPTTNNLMYLMPKISTRVTLLIPDEDERNAFATNSPRTNGDEIHNNLEPLLDHRSGEDDYKHRALSTEHDKHMLLHPDRINFIGTGSETSPLQIHMEDLEMMLFQSHKETKIIAEDSIEIVANEIGVFSPTNIHVIRTGQAGIFQPLIVPVGTGHIPVQPPEAVINYSLPTYLHLHNRFDIEGRRGILRAWEHTYFPPFDDAPDLSGSSGFSIWRSIGKALAVFAVITAAIILTPITATAAALAIIGTAVAVGMVLANDIKNQENSSLNTFLREGVTGAIAGAILNPFASAFLANTVDFIWSQFDESSDMTFRDLVFNTALSFGLSAVGGWFPTTRIGQRISNNRLVRTVVNNRLVQGASNIINAPVRWIENVVTGLRRPISNYLLRTFPTNRVISWYAQRLDPVDSISGVVFYELIDLEYQGIIPFKWERNYNSGNSNKLSPMGYGMSSLYFMYIEENLEHKEELEIKESLSNENETKNNVESENEPYKYHTFIDSKGRTIYFDTMQENERTIIREENIHIAYNGNSYEIFNYNEGLYYTFEKSEKENRHRLSKIQNITKSHSIKLTYNNNNLVIITDTGDRVFNITTNNQGLITKITFDKYTLLQYEYNEHKDLVKITDIKDDIAEIAYKNHLMIKRITLEGATFHWEYDGNNHKAKCVHSYGTPKKTKTFKEKQIKQQERTLLEGWFYYKEDHTIFKNDLGRWEIFYFDEEKKLTSIVEVPRGDIDPDMPLDLEDLPKTTFTYTEYGEQETVTNQDNETITYSYNDFGQVVEVTKPTGATQQLEYNSKGQVTKSIAPIGLATTWEYDENEYLQQITYPNGVTKTYTYNNKGLVETTTENLNINENETRIEKENINGQNIHNKNITLFEYSKRNYIEKITHPNGATESYKYNIFGNCISYTNPLGATETMKYDLAGRMIEHTSPEGSITKLKYNAYTDIVSLKNNERDITLSYTPLGNIAIKTERNKSMQFTYNSHEELMGIENEAGEKYTFIRNHQGKVIEEIGFDNVRKLYNYTKAGKLSGIKRSNTAYWTRLKYNKVGQLSKIIYNDETKETPEEELFTYNSEGLLLETKNKDVTLSFEYDMFGNVTKQTQAFTDTLSEYEVTSEFNSPYMFMRTKLQSNLGLDLDLNSSLKETTMTVSNENLPAWEHKETYNLLGQIENRTIQAGTTTITDNWTYDNIGRPQTQKSTVNNRENTKKKYTWNLGTQIKSIINELDNITAEYSYGKHGNAERETFKNAKHIFDVGESEVTRHLDETGKLYKTTSKLDTKYHEGGQLRTAKAGKVFYTYNDCGDLIEKYDKRTKETWKYEYNINGLMSKVIRPDKKAVTFKYDPLGRRISKSFDGITTKFVWDKDKVIHEWKETKEDVIKEKPSKPTQAEIDEFVKTREKDLENHLEDLDKKPDTTPSRKLFAKVALGIIPSVIEDETRVEIPQNLITWIYDENSFTPRLKILNNNINTVISDHLGTPQKMINQDGVVTWYAITNLYGKKKLIENKERQPFRFQGQYEDIETGGMYYNRYRYYMSDEGVYTQRDPIGLAGGNPSLYGYVWNTLTHIDPLGLVDIIYRAVNLLDIQNMDLGLGILPKNPTGNLSAFQHVFEGSEGSQFLSFTRDKSFAHRWARRSNTEVISIDLDLLPNNTIDLSTVEGRISHLGDPSGLSRSHPISRANGLAEGASEILVEGSIPMSSINRLISYR